MATQSIPVTNDTTSSTTTKHTEKQKAEDKNDSRHDTEDEHPLILDETEEEDEESSIINKKNHANNHDTSVEEVTVDGSSATTNSDASSQDQGKVSQQDAAASKAATDNNNRNNKQGHQQQQVSEQILHCAQTLLQRERQVQWVTDLLCESVGYIRTARKRYGNPQFDKSHFVAETTTTTTFRTPWDEKTVVLSFPWWDESSSKASPQDPNDNDDNDDELDQHDEIPSHLYNLLHDFVSMIAATHAATLPFSNFEHTGQVVTCVSEIYMEMTKRSQRTFTTNPWTGLAVLLAALTVNVNRPTTDACHDWWTQQHYQNTSVETQNALDVAWQIFCLPQFAPLHDVCCATPMEMAYLRHVWIHATWATTPVGLDAMTTKTQPARKRPAHVDKVHWRTTVLLEYVMQISMVAHVLQQVKIYQRYTYKRIQESVQQYPLGQEGTLSSFSMPPPSVWYNAEAKFLATIFPLVQVLRDVGLVSTTWLHNLEGNQAYWNKHGMELVQKVMQHQSTAKESLA